nr:LapA family protein [Acuticoccus kalidii]
MAAAAIVILAAANRQPITLAVSPFRAADDLTISLPLYAILFATLAAGVVIGGLGSWYGRRHRRRSARLEQRELQRLRGEVDALRTAAAQRPPLAAPRAPLR